MKLPLAALFAIILMLPASRAAATTIYVNDAPRSDQSS